MNIDNINKAIKVMKRIERSGKILDMIEWYDDDLPLNKDPKYIKEITEDNYCGTAACFFGWLAISQEGKEMGLDPVEDGYASQLSKSLDISKNLAANLIGESSFYDKNSLSDVEISDVISRLEEIRDTGKVVVTNTTIYQ